MSNLLYLVRHAHRDKSPGAEIDNGLDDLGKQQAAQLSMQLASELQGRSVSLISSPARRCVETLKPLSEHLSQPIDAVAVLHDQQEGENAVDFLSRLNEFQAIWDDCHSDILVACTHGDVIPELTQILAGTRATLAKGTFTKIERDSSGPVLSSV